MGSEMCIRDRMWDNRCVLHKATGGFEGHERLLHRTTIGFNPEVGTA